MKTKTLLFSLAGIAAVLVIVGFIHFNRQGSSNSLQPPLQAQQSNDNLSMEPFPLGSPGSNLQKNFEELARRRGVSLSVLTQQLLLEFSNAMHAAAGQVNRPIEFYGKVVCDSGEALSGAEVRFGCVGFPEKIIGTNTLTDAQGMFALSGLSGTILNVLVRKAGYEELPGTNKKQFHFYDGPNSFRSDSNNPVVFHLHKKTQ